MYGISLQLLMTCLKPESTSRIASLSLNKFCLSTCMMFQQTALLRFYSLLWKIVMLQYNLSSCFSSRGQQNEKCGSFCCSVPLIPQLRSFTRRVSHLCYQSLPEYRRDCSGGQCRTISRLVPR